MQISFRSTLPGLDRCAFLLEREGAGQCGDFESAIFAGATDIRRYPDDGCLARRLCALAAETAVQTMVVLRNPRLVLDGELMQRIALAQRRLAGLNYSIAAAGGLTPEGGRACLLYTATTPFLPVDTRPTPLIDPLPDLWLADAGLLRDLAEDGPLPGTGIETILALRGYLEGRIALALPELTAGVDGPLLPRDPAKMIPALKRWLRPMVADRTVETLMGPVALDEEPREAIPGTDLGVAIDRTIAAACAPLSLSIVTRTRFDRPHLLERLLASITRARSDGMDLEVVLSSDADPALCRARMAELEARFVNLTLRLCHNPDGGPSRVGNLLAGLRAATRTHVAIVDDDDYVDLFGFQTLSRALFLGTEPLIAVGSEVHDEVWEATPRGRHVLARSTLQRSWPAEGWRQLFAGVNALPICGLVMPRARLQARLDAFEFRHDLSEDYALFLLVLTDPELPPVVELPGTFAHISIRGDGQNSVTMPDRRPWVRDIALYLRDLTQSGAVAGPGVWRLLASRPGAEEVLAGQSLAECRAALDRRERELALMRRQIAELRAAALAEEAPA